MFPNIGFLPGMNFGKMNIPSEEIGKLLDDPKTTVEDLLKVEEIIQEFDSKNEKLINFFDKEKVKHLLDYIIKEQEDEKDKGYKFPFVCSQIFGLELEKIMKYFFITNKQMQEIEKEETKNSKKDKKKDTNKEGKEKGNKKDKKNPKPQPSENKIELLDYVFTFLEEKNKLNYVLSGYFSSLILNLLNINPKVLVKYIYIERKDVLDNMVNHCYRKSISDILSKLLHFENYFQTEPLDEKTKSDMNDTRTMLFIDIFGTIDINMDNEDLTSIYFFITGLFDLATINDEKNLFIEIINNRRILKSLITKPFFNLDLISYNQTNFEMVENRRKNFSIIIDIIISFLKNIKKLKLEGPTCISDSKFNITHTKLSEEIFINLNYIIKNNFNKKNDEEKPVLQCFNEFQLKPLGEYKIKIVDLLNNLVRYFQKISKFFDEILIETEFFKNAFDYIYQYEWNNLYQESLLNFLNSLLIDGNNHQLLHEYLFNNLKIIEMIKMHTNIEDKFKLSEGISIPISHGYYSFFISLSYKINTVIGGKPIVVNNNLLKQGIFTFRTKVPEEGDKKAAANLLYGFYDIENKEKNEIFKNEEKEIEEEKGNYDLMQKYLNDNWSEYFGLNIEDVIKQYENNDWPKIDKNNNNKEKKIIEEGRLEPIDKSKEKKELVDEIDIDEFFGEDNDEENENQNKNEKKNENELVDNVDIDDFFSDKNDEKKENEKEKENEIENKKELSDNIDIDDFIAEDAKEIKDEQEKENKNEKEKENKNENINELSDNIDIDNFIFDDNNKDVKNEKEKENKSKNEKSFTDKNKEQNQNNQINKEENKMEEKIEKIKNDIDTKKEKKEELKKELEKEKKNEIDKKEEEENKKQDIKRKYVKRDIKIYEKK
jgi:hypothetical protein